METMQNTKNRTDGKQHSEGKATKAIEKTTAAVPSVTFLMLAGGSIVTSLVLKLLGRDSTANFVGQWAPTLLMLGIYNKIVKVMGSDRREVFGH
jgi:hypothetical protein